MTTDASDAVSCAYSWAEYRKDDQPNPSQFTAAHKAFEAGWEAARDHLAQREPTDAEIDAAAIQLCASAHHGRTWEALAKVGPARQDRLRVDARRALTAAKEARA